MADLRGTSVDYKRENTNKAKWARGEQWGPGRKEEAHSAPARIRPRIPRNNRDLKLRNARDAQRLDVRDNSNTHSDSSGDEMPLHSSAAPEPDAGVAYSFDAAKGPTHGSTVLSTALAKAVERFESNATEKLIKDEYEVLGEFDVRTPIKKGGKRSAMTAEEEDDYEFI